MRKLTSLALPAAPGATVKLDRGRLVIAKGKHVVGLRLKATVALANTSGGAVVLSDAQKQALLALLTFNLSYGRGGNFRPYQGVNGARLHMLQRFCYGSEMEGYNDAATGLSKSLPNGQTTSLVFWPIIPTGKLWMLEDARNAFGLGRSQCQTLELEVRLGSSITVLTGVVLSGAVTFELAPDEAPAKSDRWFPCYEWSEQTEVDKVARLAEGLPLLIAELSAVHASSVITDFSFHIDDEVIHEQVSPQEAITGYNDSATAPAAASVVDRVTQLYAVSNDVRLRDLPTGQPRFTQNKKDLATANIGQLTIPIRSESELFSEFEHAANNLRRKTLKAVSSFQVDGIDVPDRLRFASPATLFDEDDKEFELYPGVEVKLGGKARYIVPQSILDRSNTLYAQHKSRGENKAAEDVIRRIAAVSPGAVQSGRGFGEGSRSQTLAATQSYFR